MSITEYIFKDDESRTSIKNLFSKLVSLLADINEVPLFLPNYFQSPQKSPDIAKILDALVEIFEHKIDSSLVAWIQNNHRIVVFMAEGSEDSESSYVIRLILQIIVKDINDIFFNFDKYIEENPMNHKVFQTIKGLSQDKYGLTEIDGNFNLSQHGLVYKKKYLIYYHQFLRRFYTSNFTETTILLGKVADDKNLKLSLRIDPFRLTTPNYLRNIMEFDYWRGPKFSLAKLNDLNYSGLSVYKRIKNEPYVNWEIDRTEFYISNYEDEQKEIQIEEINPKENHKLSSKYSIQRYAHLIWSKKKNCFTHFDVAVRIYTKAMHLIRFGYEWFPKNINFPAHSERMKLFRIDGDIKTEQCIDLLSHFFRYNELINEFFEGK